MNVSYRKATLDDVPTMFEVRRDSILQLAPRAMSIQQAENWASSLTLQGMTARLGDARFWVAEIGKTIVGWVGIRHDEVCGIYVHPDWVNRGIGSGLLRLAETLLLAAGIKTVRLEASWNAEAFYMRQGYKTIGSRSVDDTRVFVKSLRSEQA